MFRNKTIIFVFFVFFLIVLAVLLWPFREDLIDEEQEVLLYFSDQEAMYLEAETRRVAADNIFYNTLNELISGPKRDSVFRTLPEEVEVKEISVSENVAIINFSKNFIEQHVGGSTGERITVYSIVNTMNQFDEIDSVKFLVEGEEIETLGHMDLSQPVFPSQDLIQD